MNNKETHIDFWSILEKYDTKHYDIIIEKVEGADKIKISVYKRFMFKVLGYKISKQKLRVEWVIDISAHKISLDKNIFDSIVNPQFVGDIAVNCSEYMKYAEKGFNENKIDTLEVLAGIKLPEKIIGSLKEFNYRLDLLHCAVGIASEAGEILDHIKTYVYHNKPLDKAAIASEIGDYNWYMFNMMRLLSIAFSDTLKANKIKLDARYPQGRDKNYLKNVKDTKKENELIQKELYSDDKTA